MSHVREIVSEGFQIKLDLSEQVLALDLPEAGWHRHRSAVENEAAPVCPVLPDMGREFVSAGALLLKAKQFDDGLYAAVDLAAQKGLGRFAGKAFLLTALAQRLAEAGADCGGSLAVLFAACRLGNLPAEAPASLQPAVEEVLSDFLKDERRSKPIGFYTWTEELTAIFRQDRMLQTELRAAPLVEILRADKKLRDTYVEYLQLIARLTNPLRHADLRSLLDPTGSMPLNHSETLCIIPPSRSWETDLIEKLYSYQTIPEGFDLMEELINRIRTRRLELRPTEESGWYDHQLWSLEPLVLPEDAPEAKRLELEPEYRKHLIDLFKAVYALTRETHVKQLAAVRVGCAPPAKEIIVAPELSAEPLATTYLRRMLSYRFVRQVLLEHFGAEALNDLQRITAEGSRSVSLAEELADIEKLFLGAHVTVCRQLGMEHDALIGAQEAEDAAASFGRWKAAMGDDEDLTRDARMMVPVFYDIERRKTKVWLFLGWTTKPLTVSFAKPPGVVRYERVKAPPPAGRLESLWRKFKSQPDSSSELPLLSFTSSHHQLASPVMAEVYVDKILDRDEFRRHCDQHRTFQAIVSNLC